MDGLNKFEYTSIKDEYRCIIIKGKKVFLKSLETIVVADREMKDNLLNLIKLQYVVIFFFIFEHVLVRM